LDIVLDECSNKDQVRFSLQHSDLNLLHLFE
jgi:hypothetical protein